MYSLSQPDDIAYNPGVLVITLSLALAQEEACVPTPSTALQGLLEKAEESLDSMDTEGAATALDAAAESARCLDQPIARPLLARLAWDRAEWAAADMDTEGAWSWIRLAQDAGASEPADRVPETHPLRRVFAEPEADVPISGPTGVKLHAPKKGSIYADGTRLEAPAVRVSTPHLVQVFDKDSTPYLGVWQQGPAFPATLLTPLIAEGNRIRRSEEAGDELPPPNWKPRRLGTAEAYRDWLRKHPKGPWLQDAKDGLDDLDWEAARIENTELAARQYIHDYPDGLHVDEARFVIEDLKYRELLASPSREAWSAFLKAHPEGIYAAEARVQIELLDWNTAHHSDTDAAYTRYLELHPKGRNRELAIVRQQLAAFDEARERGTDSALQSVLDRWPDGPWAPEARAMLGGIEFTEVSVEVSGEVDPAVIERVRADLLAELDKRELPVLEPGADVTNAGRIQVELGISPGDKITGITAHLVLLYQALRRPLTELHIDSKMLPDADAGAALGEMLVANLHPMKRWLPPEPEEDSKK